MSNTLLHVRIHLSDLRQTVGYLLFFLVLLDLRFLKLPVIVHNLPDLPLYNLNQLWISTGPNELIENLLKGIKEVNRELKGDILSGITQVKWLQFTFFLGLGQFVG